MKSLLGGLGLASGGEVESSDLLDEPPRLLKRGAEADLYISTFEGYKVIVKRRVCKSYRLPELDRRIREYRTSHEAQLLHEAKVAGVPTPIIFFVDRVNFEIIMLYIEGVRLRDCLGEMSEPQRSRICRTVGYSIALLHRNEIVHGDLTTSNLILTADGRLFFVDFGLGFHSRSLEDQGVDLFLLLRALQSYHYRYAKSCFTEVMKGYGKVVGSRKLSEVEAKIEEIRRRGRYVLER
ncbi:MAG: KEOPS complex kinase/ATPase Bud32 [Candidatus Bathyarchaeia archaeon]